jgi:hypothetical protein
MFTYAKASIITRNFDLPMSVDSRVVERVLGRKCDLFDLKLNRERRISDTNESSIHQNFEKLAWRYEYLRKATGRVLSQTLGDEEIKRVRQGPRYLRGFFQDYRVAEQYIELNGKAPLALSNPSNEYLTLSEEMARKEVLAVHIRRGDYQNHADTFGLLSWAYYKSAIEYFREKAQHLEVWFFTDSRDEIENDTKPQYPMAKIFSPNDYCPAETMHLMSKASALVTSNSTYSFWAATLADHNSVIVPQKWFKSDDPWLNQANLQNPKWKQIPSTWLE